MVEVYHGLLSLNNRYGNNVFDVRCFSPGAIYTVAGSSVSIDGDSEFYGNLAGGGGGEN